MSAGSNRDVDHEIHIGHDDYSLSRVPKSDRYSWVTVAVQRFGQLSALSQFLLGATLGFGMSFWNAFLALTLGAVILEVVAIFVGIAGMREGLSTSVLSRWTGFGRYGSSLIGLVFAISLIGWFGVQNAVFAEGVYSLIGGIPVWAWSIITGAVVIVVVVYGFLSMAWVAYITVPAFLFLAGYSIASALRDYSLGELVTSPPPGETLTLAAGTTIVAGGFMVGAIGTFLSAVGILEQFVPFLTALGVVVPPIAGIMVVDYYLLRRHREPLEESASAGTLPARQEQLNPVAIFAWAAASVIGFAVQWGIPTLNALICAAVLYYVGMKVIAAVQRQDRVIFAETAT